MLKRNCLVVLLLMVGMFFVHSATSQVTRGNVKIAGQTSIATVVPPCLYPACLSNPLPAFDTATQAILTYTASTTNQCTIEVSTNGSTYGPVALAVDATKFSGANTDGQTNAGPRTLVIGQRSVAQENANPPSITVGGSAATRTSYTPPGVGTTYGAITVAYPSPPFVTGDNITVTGMGNPAYNTSWGKVMNLCSSVSGGTCTSSPTGTAGFVYWVPSSGSDTSGGGTITRANRYSLALENNTQYYYRIGGPSNICGASPSTGTFTTMNWPNGNTWSEDFPTGSNGAWIAPSTPESHAAGAGLIVDPITGTLTKLLTLWSDAGPTFGSMGGTYGDIPYCTSSADSNGFIHCYTAFNGGSVLYGLNPGTNEVRYLGNMLVTSGNTGCPNAAAPPTGDNGWSPTDPNSFYIVCQSSAGEYLPEKCTLNGSDTPHVGGSVVLAGSFTQLSTGLLAATQAFDPSFVPSQQNHGVVFFIDGHYLLMIFRRWNQGSPSWLVEFNLTTNTVVAATSSWANQQSATSCTNSSPYVCNGSPRRWGGLHGQGDLQATSQGWTGFSLGSYVPGQAYMGYFMVTLNQSAGLNNADATDTITVTSGCSTPWAANTVYAVGNCVLDSNGDLEYVRSTTGGAESGSSPPSWPAAGCSYATPTADFQTPPTNGVTWACSGLPGNPMSQDQPPDGSHYLDQALPGDMFKWNDGTNEIVMVLARNSATSLTIARGCASTGYPTWYYSCSGTNEYAHSNGAQMYSFLTELADGNPTYNDWNFVNDPHGSDQSGTNVVWDKQILTGHFGCKIPVMVDEGYGGVTSWNWNAALWATGYTWMLSTGPTFNNFSIPCTGDACQPYFAYDPADPFVIDYVWNTGSYSGGPALDTVTEKASGTGYTIYQYNLASGHAFSPWYPYFSLNGSIKMREISAPGSALAQSAGGNDTVCIVYQAGECWPGSTVGQIYANLSSSSITGCTLAENAIIASGDWCVTNVPNAIHGMMQLGFPANIVSAGPPPVIGFSASRKLVVGMFIPYRGPFTWARQTPDRSWVFWNTNIYDPYFNTENPNNGFVGEIYGALVPPQPLNDGIDRTNFEGVVIPVGAASGATQGRLKWGYEENEPVKSTTWPPTIHFYCEQYQGTCYWNGSATSPSFSSSSFTPLPLNSNTTLQVGVPQRVVFYQIDYLGSDGSVVASGPLTPFTVP